MIGSIPLGDDGLRIRAVTDPKAALVSHTHHYLARNTCLCVFVCQNCFEIYKEDGVIKAWKKDSDGKPVPGMMFSSCVCVLFIYTHYCTYTSICMTHITVHTHTHREP